MISPKYIATRGYLGNSLSIATDGYIAPVSDTPFFGPFIEPFVESFSGNFISALTNEDNG